MIVVDGKPGKDVELPQQLVDAWARLEQVDDDFVALQREIDHFALEYYRRMPQGRDPETGDYTIKFNHPSANAMTGRPQVLAVRVMEGIRSALDYVVFQLSLFNYPGLENKRAPQFLIADTKADFRKAAGSRLRHLTAEQMELVESLQPFRGNFVLGVLRDAVNASKHRQLLELEDGTGADMYIVPARDKGRYRDARLIWEDDRVAYFVRLREHRVALMGKYKATRLLKEMGDQAVHVVLASRKYFDAPAA